MADRIETSGSIAQEPNWLNGDLKLYPDAQPRKYEDDDPVQQSDLMKPLLLDIAKHGLPYAYAKYIEESNPEPYKSGTATNPKDVIIIGAGMAGLLAGFELQRAGHRVHILEKSQRIGGRIKTFEEKDGFAKGLYSDGKCSRVYN